MTRACEQRHDPSFDRPHHPGVMRGRTVAPHLHLASSAWLLAILVGATSCNSLLGIREASLTCDAPPCDPADAPGTTGADVGPSSGAARVPDGGTALDGASGNSDPIGAGAAPAGSGASSDGTPVLPTVPSPRADADEASSANGVPARGGSGGVAEDSSAGAAGDGSAAMGGVPSAAGAGGAQGGAACGGGDVCATCLCEECEGDLAACSDTPGCLEILACARNSGCSGFACYCGTIELLQCATTDLANGPCLAVMLAAPGAHPPSLVDPNAGPASQRAFDLANCSRLSCAIACDN